MGICGAVVVAIVDLEVVAVQNVKVIYGHLAYISFSFSCLCWGGADLERSLLMLLLLIGVYRQQLINAKHLLWRRRWKRKRTSKRGRKRKVERRRHI